MKKIKTEELKAIQLNIMSIISNFCYENNIEYFLSYGTLIGAIRHNGYIPWDDDIDICMSRYDYERFIFLFNKNNSRYKVIEHRINNQYKLPFAKVLDTNTIMHEDMYIKDNFGVYIDIFPIDGIKSTKQINQSIFFNKLLNTKRAAINNPKRSIFKRVILSIGKIIIYPISIHYLLDKITKIATIKSYEDSKYVANIVSPYGKCEIMPKEYFKEFYTHKFEDRFFKIPKEYDKYLKCIYGDYMQLPPIEQQVTHHSFKAWWKE